ncbi:hypothetical protein SAMN04488066_11833 [Halorubrum aquaticum]|uniref:Uncharacterized protein n=1 Tax=Halorubrum aquaticum TaxID=387340 RepID=A0A1I3C3H7_9EURY|nr:hypothetical protein [Halorubrum aquaticum]SFH69010.1 hypothetical protein SAMN04488066_11833 [Halorubrum aquaticum]
MYDSIAALVRQEGWRAEGAAARVHYDGGGDRFAVEFYAEADAVLYWTVPERTGGRRASPASEGGSAASGTDSASGTDTAAPVPRESVPDPLRRRIRDDLSDAGVDPAVERRTV